MQDSRQMPSTSKRLETPKKQRSSRPNHEPSPLSWYMTPTTDASGTYATPMTSSWVSMVRSRRRKKSSKRSERTCKKNSSWNSRKQKRSSSVERVMKTSNTDDQ